MPNVKTRLDDTLDMLESKLRVIITACNESNLDQELAAVVFCAQSCLSRKDLKSEQRKRAIKLHDQADKLYRFREIYKKF